MTTNAKKKKNIFQGIQDTDGTIVDRGGIIFSVLLALYKREIIGHRAAPHVLFYLI